MTNLDSIFKSKQGDPEEATPTLLSHSAPSSAKGGVTVSPSLAVVAIHFIAPSPIAQDEERERNIIMWIISISNINNNNENEML